MTMTGGSSVFGQTDCLVAQPNTFGALVEMLTQSDGGHTRVAVLQVPGDLGARGFPYYCSFADPFAV